MQNIIKRESVNGLDVVFGYDYEFLNPRNLFDESCYDVDQICRDIDNGKYIWCIACIDIYKAGILIGSSSLGGILTESESDLTDDYFKELFSLAIEDASKSLQEKISALTQALIDIKKFN